MGTIAMTTSQRAVSGRPPSLYWTLWSQGVMAGHSVQYKASGSRNRSPVLSLAVYHWEWTIPVWGVSSCYTHVNWSQNTYYILNYMYYYSLHTEKRSPQYHKFTCLTWRNLSLSFKYSNLMLVRNSLYLYIYSHYTTTLTFTNFSPFREDCRPLYQQEVRRRGFM